MQSDSTSREQMFSLIEDWKRSGLTRQAYCRAHSIGYHRFLYWDKKFQAANAVGLDEPSSFISLAVPSVVPSAELIYPDGRRLLFHQGVDPTYLKALLA